MLLQAALELLGLTHTANTVVGDALTRGISGGERRRVSIAVEVICGHKIVIADSPTNGLDSAAAISLIRTAHVMTKRHGQGGASSFMAAIRQVGHGRWIFSVQWCYIDRAENSLVILSICRFMVANPAISGSTGALRYVLCHEPWALHFLGAH